MKYNFPKDLYTDVRIEHVFLIGAQYSMSEITQVHDAKDSGAFIRVYDGKRWYYSAVSDLDLIQVKIDELAARAEPNPNITNLKIYEKFSLNKDICMQYENNNYSNIPSDKIIEALKNLEDTITKNEYIKYWRLSFYANYIVKEFYSSKGSDLKFDYQYCNFACSFKLSINNEIMDGLYLDKSDLFLTEPDFIKNEILKEINEVQTFLRDSVPVKKGKYTVIFSPDASGIFAHECFGHKSESDYLKDNKDEWAIGKQIANSVVSIIDSGTSENKLHIPYDDEGNKTQKTFLIKDGILSGQLHNCYTADWFNMPVTGNARAVSFEYEPLVRMTNTYIEEGDKSLEELLYDVAEGIFVKNTRYGTGMTTFTIAPWLAYYIRDGKIAEPVRVSVVSGNVFEALKNIDAVSNAKKISTGGCGKLDQFPLITATGGPYIRVRDMEVQ